MARINNPNALVGAALLVSFAASTANAFTAPQPAAFARGPSVAFGFAPSRHAGNSLPNKHASAGIQSGLAATKADKGKEDDQAKTLKVIMNHIAEIEDAVEKKQGVGAAAAATASTAAGSSGAVAAKTDSGSRFNPFKGLTKNAPTDGMNRLVFMLSFMTGVADVAMVLKYKNFATMVRYDARWWCLFVAGVFLCLYYVFASNLQVFKMNILDDGKYYVDGLTHVEWRIRTGNVSGCSYCLVHGWAGNIPAHVPKSQGPKFAAVRAHDYRGIFSG